VSRLAGCKAWHRKELVPKGESPNLLFYAGSVIAQPGAEQAVDFDWLINP